MAILGKGLDLSSSSITCDSGDGDGQDISTSIANFVEIPSSNLSQFSNIPTFSANGKVYAFGREAAYVGSQTGSFPLKSQNVITSDSDEDLGRAVISLSSNFLGTPRVQDEYVYFSVPSVPLDSDCAEFDPSQVATYHAAFYLRELSRLGYRPIPIPEGQAIVLNEAKKDGYTAVGISFGMAFINAAIVKNRRLLRVITQTRAGNWIEEQVALDMGKSLLEVSRARLAFDPTNIRSDMGIALRDYYRKAMDEILNRLDASFLSLNSSDRFPMIWAGPMTAIKSFTDLARERFNNRSLEQTFSARIIGQRRGTLPTSSVVQGLLKQATEEYSHVHT